MGISEILASIDHEIAQLRQARALLGGGSATPKKKPGRPKKLEAAYTAKAAKRKKRTLTPEGRIRIVEAQKLRWAAQKKATPTAQK
jgi:hypothetical protein